MLLIQSPWHGAVEATFHPATAPAAVGEITGLAAVAQKGLSPCWVVAGSRSQCHLPSHQSLAMLQKVAEFMGVSKRVTCDPRAADQQEILRALEVV